MELSDIILKNKLNEIEQDEFSAYIANRFDNCKEINGQDTDFLEVWESIIYYADLFGAANAINTKLLPKKPVKFNSPETVEIKIYTSFAGKIPIIYVRNTEDFEQLVTNIAYKGIRPEGIEKTGASFISGKVTRFIILSAKPYSNVSACELGLDEENWAEKSLLLRREHECTHYFTKQTYGITNNILHDEIIADFIGMYEAFGFYRAEWFLKFMGIIEGGGSRFTVYTKELSPNVSAAVSELMTVVAYKLEEWSKTDSFKSLLVAERIRIMCRAGFSGMIKSFCAFELYCKMIFAAAIIAEVKIDKKCKEI